MLCCRGDRRRRRRPAAGPYTARDGATGRSSVTFMFRLDAPVSTPVGPARCIAPSLQFAGMKYRVVRLNAPRAAYGLKLRIPRRRATGTIVDHGPCTDVIVEGEPASPLPPPKRIHVRIALLARIRPAVAIGDLLNRRVVYVAWGTCEERMTPYALARCLRRASR